MRMVQKIDWTTIESMVKSGSYSSPSEIASAYGCAESTLRRWLSILPMNKKEEYFPQLGLRVVHRKKEVSKADWRVTETDLLRAKCAHKNSDGTSALYTDENGKTRCPICGATFTPIQYIERSALMSQKVNSLEALLSSKHSTILSLTDKVRELEVQLQQQKDINEEQLELQSVYQTEIEELNDKIGGMKPPTHTDYEYEELQKTLEFLVSSLTEIVPFMEQPHYEAEYRDCILYAVEQQLKVGNLSARMRIVLQDILDGNPHSETYEREQLAIRKIAKLSSSKRELDFLMSEAGFEKLQTSGHPKFCYRGDKRLMITHSLTPSDVRAFKNLASEIDNVIY